MKVALLTREFPPEVYGGAGVHVEYLSRELAHLVDVEVHCFGGPRPSDLVAATYLPWSELPSGPHGSALRAMSVGLHMAAGVAGVDLVHSHTWYTNLAGHLAKLLYRVPHVMTAHSLEPLRRWKAEQLGAGYALSSFSERTAIDAADAVIALSHAMRADVLSVYPEVDPRRIHVIHNGIDPNEYQPDKRTNVLERLGIDPDRPLVLFVGRTTHDKGIIHLLEAAKQFDSGAQLVLCARAPDTAPVGDEISDRVVAVERQRGRVLWVEETLARAEVIQLLSHASVFVCPSLDEPSGLINLEAMACGVPVVASAPGGIFDIIADGQTGFLVPFRSGRDVVGSPRDPVQFAGDLADRVNELLADPATAQRLGQAGRQRVLDDFSWTAVAARTAALYAQLLA